jgi:C1A family cysteine protease
MATYFKGHVRRPDKDHLIQLSHLRHADHLRRLKAAPAPPNWDSRTQGLIGPIKDQGQCGSCWDFSGTGCVEVAYNKAGIGGGATQFVLSEEYTLSCYRSGQCQGDDNTTALDWAKANGLPLTSDYGPYKAAPGQCLYKPTMTLFRVDDWGFADSNGGNGVTPIPDIKAAIMQYGAVGCAIIADNSFQAYTGGVWAGSGDTNPSHIDHDVLLVGWDDSTQSWILRNSWGTGWGEAGYMRIKYGANLVGTEAVWAVRFPGQGN